MHNLTLRYAQQYVTSASYRKKIEKNIKTAGLERELNVDEYIGFQILLEFFCLPSWHFLTMPYYWIYPGS